MSDLSESLWRPRVRTAADDGEDSYVKKVVLYIPGEIVAAYATLSGFQVAAKLPDKPWLVVITVVLGALTVPWLLFGTRTKDKKPPVFQALAGLVAYLFWVFNLSGDKFFDWYNHFFGASLLVVFTLVVPLLERIVFSGADGQGLKHKPAQPAAPPASKPLRKTSGRK